MVSMRMRDLLAGMAAIAASLGWLQLAPAFGLPVTASAGMLDRLFGADREVGALGWALLLVGEAAFVAFYFVVIEPRTRKWFAPIVSAVVAWLLSGAVVMPLIGLVQGAPLPSAAASDPMRASFFMLHVGLGAAAAALIAWLLLGVVLASARKLDVTGRSLGTAIGGALVAAAVAFALPALVAGSASGRVVEGRVAALPAGPVFISVLELPQEPGAVLGPHRHVPGFVMNVAGTATLSMDGKLVDVGPGDAVFTENQALHAHLNRAGVPPAVALGVVIVGLSIALLVGGRRSAVGLMTVLLIAGTVAAIDPLMNRWYFIAVRPVAQRGGMVPVPAGHRTYESADLSGIASGPVTERLTDRRLGSSDSIRVVGPAAIVVLDGEATVADGGRETAVRVHSGTTIGGGAEATVRSTSGTTRVLVIQILPGN